MARVRSPNYPALSLPAAIDRARTIQAKEGRNSMTRDVIVKHLGFGSLNGASATVLSALSKYGLLTAEGDGESRVSDLAMSILFPHDEEEKRNAVREAAFMPALFAKIHEKWPDRAPSDEGLRSYLVRDGFSQAAAEQVIQFYRETLEMVGGPRMEHGSSANHSERELPQMTLQTAPRQGGNVVPAPAPSATPLPAGKPFAISIDGDVLTGTLAIRSLRDFDRMMKVLTAQRPALEAALEDEEGEDDLNG